MELLLAALVELGDGLDRAVLERPVRAFWARSESIRAELPMGERLVARHLLAVGESHRFEAWLEEASADLWLAGCCVAGMPAALRRFEAAMAPALRTAARRSSAMDPEDLVQLLMTRLFVGDGVRGPRILEYSGRSELRSWVRVVAARMLVDRARVRSTHEPSLSSIEPAALDLTSACDDPELLYLQRLYRGELTAALELATASLSSTERALLRLSHVEGASIDVIAERHGVHRATAARQLSAARDALRAATRAALADRLRLGARELDSVLRAVAGVPISVQRMLAS